MKVIMLLIAALTSAHPQTHQHRGDPPRHALDRCTSTNWRSVMTSGERWVARHESGMNPRPTDVNPSSGARELGQLLPSTLSGLNLTPSWHPCTEVHHMRVYINERYGSTERAIAFWREHEWY